MLVNSAFKGLFTHQLVVRSIITIVLPAVFFISSSFTKRSDRDLRVKQTNLLIRQIGHRLLLQSGDFSSRVLPVTEIKEGTFLLSFENEFVFRHDSLMMLSRALLPIAEFPSGYIVTVHDCMKASIVYGFQINNTSPNILPCRGRSEPPGCYTIEFFFPDFYENVEQEKEEPKKADIHAVSKEVKSAKVDSQRVNPISIAIRTEESKSVKVVPLEANPIPRAIGTKELKTTAFDYPLMNLIYGGMLVLGVTLLIGRYKKSLVPATPSDRQNQNPALIKESVPELTALGKFSFDVKAQHLLLGSEVISLTDKEYKILELLNDNFGELIPRETLMQKIWISEGVITGRSLDMFVSKLRKKLSGDPELRITNVHGKGYKLEILNCSSARDDA